VRTHDSHSRIDASRHQSSDSVEQEQKILAWIIDTSDEQEPYVSFCLHDSRGHSNSKRIEKCGRWRRRKEMDTLWSDIVGAHHQVTRVLAHRNQECSPPIDQGFHAIPDGTQCTVKSGAK
jgi:hypothetical protein